MNNKDSDPSPNRDASRCTEDENDYRTSMNKLIMESKGTLFEKIENFTKYLPRQTFARYLALYETYKKALHIHGDIMECGVHWGGGLMAYALMSSVLEPFNFQRRIVGFDTFTGFTPPAESDKKSTVKQELMQEGSLNVDSHDDLLRCIELYNQNRPVGHIDKVILKKGDAVKTIPQFFEEHPYTIVSLLHLDFDIHEPTKAALAHILPRMPKGAVIVFDELNSPVWPGETVALYETIGVKNMKIERFPFEPSISYAILS